MFPLIRWRNFHVKIAIVFVIVAPSGDIADNLILASYLKFFCNRLKRIPLKAQIAH